MLHRFERQNISLGRAVRGLLKCLKLRTEFVPGTRRGLLLDSEGRRILCHDDSETVVQVPINVAVEEPGPWVVRYEPNRHVVTRVTN